MDTITIDAMVVTILVGTLLPLLVGVVTKAVAHSGVKAVLLLLFTAVEGLLITATQIDGTAVLSAESIIFAAVGWISAVATYFGLWKPSQVATKVQSSTARFGIGG